MSSNIIKDSDKSSIRYAFKNITNSDGKKKKSAFDTVDRKITVSEFEGIEKQARTEGYEQGFNEGHKDGLLAGNTEVNATIRKFTALINSLNKPLYDLDDEVVEQLVQLSISVSRQIIRRELKSDTGQVMAVIREAMEILPISARNIKIYLHPSDASLVREILDVDENNDSVERSWIIVEDPVLTHGSCRIHSDNSYIDASVEQRLNKVISDLLGGERVKDTE